jgi:shikimate 5-dehydrogenase
MKRACVIGWPIKHSRSPIIHNYWLKRHGISGRYEKCEVAPDQLQAFIKGIGTDFIGCNITVPHKGAALGMLLHQAVFGFEKWFGVRPEVTPDLRKLVEADISGAAQ